jgi:hypothetical protein
VALRGYYLLSVLVLKDIIITYGAMVNLGSKDNLSTKVIRKIKITGARTSYNLNLPVNVCRDLGWDESTYLKVLPRGKRLVLERIKL